jgi:hypothetical protein
MSSSVWSTLTAGVDQVVELESGGLLEAPDASLMVA